MTSNDQNRPRFTSLNPFQRRNKRTTNERHTGTHAVQDTAAMITFPSETAPFHQFPVWRSL